MHDLVAATYSSPIKMAEPVAEWTELTGKLYLGLISVKLLRGQSLDFGMIQTRDVLTKF